jgi:hypothetical protein
MTMDFAPINLTHHFLIAMPGLMDESFSRSVIYMCEHSERGALGLIINKPGPMNMQSLFEKVELQLGRADLIELPVFQGGPVHTERGFVLHDPMSHISSKPGQLQEDIPFGVRVGFGGPGKYPKGRACRAKTQQHSTTTADHVQAILALALLNFAPRSSLPVTVRFDWNRGVLIMLKISPGNPTKAVFHGAAVTPLDRPT